MKKVLMSLVKVFLFTILAFIGFYFAYKSIVKNNLDDKLKTLNDNWTELLKLQEEKNNFLEILVNKSSLNIQYADSLNVSLIQYRESEECTPNWTYKQYLSNKYMLPLMKFYSENNQLADAEKNNVLKNIQDNIMRLNKAIEKYNSSVRDYNLYYTSFPNFIIAKSYGFKRKEYFEIEFGVENVDPKIAEKVRREWQRKIEMEYGLSE